MMLSAGAVSWVCVTGTPVLLKQPVVVFNVCDLNPNGVTLHDEHVVVPGAVVKSSAVAHALIGQVGQLRILTTVSGVTKGGMITNVVSQTPFLQATKQVFTVSIGPCVPFGVKVMQPVVGFTAGQTAPKGRKMGHAGAIIGGAEDTAEAKMAIMRECGIHVVSSPAEIGVTMKRVLNK